MAKKRVNGFSIEAKQLIDETNRILFSARQSLNDSEIRIKINRDRVRRIKNEMQDTSRKLVSLI